MLRCIFVVFFWEGRVVTQFWDKGIWGSFIYTRSFVHFRTKSLNWNKIYIQWYKKLLNTFDWPFLLVLSVLRVRPLDRHGGNHLGCHANTRVDESIFWVTLAHCIIIWTLFCLILKFKEKHWDGRRPYSVYISTWKIPGACSPSCAPKRI